MDYNWLLDKPIAHRGLWDEKYPENSLGAYQQAIEKGFNIEIDVHLLADGDFAVFHDNSTKRMCEQNVKVSTLTAKDLKNYRLKGTDYTIPTLREFLDLVDGKVGVLIEMKDTTEKYGAAEKLCAYLKDYKGDYAIQSFFLPVLKWWRDNTKDVAVGVLGCILNEWQLFSFRKHVKPDFYSYDIRRLPVSFLTKEHKKGVNLLAWTINSDKRLAKCKEQNVDNVIFDHIRIDSYK